MKSHPSVAGSQLSSSAFSSVGFLVRTPSISFPRSLLRQNPASPADCEPPTSPLPSWPGPHPPLSQCYPPKRWTASDPGCDRIRNEGEWTEWGVFCSARFHSHFKDLPSILRLYPFYLLVLEGPWFYKMMVMLDGKCFKNCTYSENKVAIHAHSLLFCFEVLPHGAIKVRMPQGGASPYRAGIQVEAWERALLFQNPRDPFEHLAFHQPRHWEDIHLTNID